MSLNNISHIQFSKTINKMNSYPFKNLVLKGGGIRGIAYLGALEVLYKEGIPQQIERVAGSSAGAMTALVIGLNLGFEETLKVANSIDFPNLAGSPDFFEEREVNDENFYEEEEAIPRGLMSAFSTLGTSMKQVKFLFQTKGLFTSTYIYDWLDEQVARVTKKPEGTFKEFVDGGGKDLYITVTNISNNSPHICSSVTTPHMKVAEAIRTSMSIPIYFESIPFNNTYLKGYFGDGGVMNNYPINLFDKDAPNPETLGLFLYSAMREQKFPDNAEYGLKNYAGDIIGCLLEAQDWYLAQQPKDVERTVQIDYKGVSATNFEMETDDENYTKLYVSGKKSMEEYLKRYKNKDTATLRKALWTLPKLSGF